MFALLHLLLLSVLAGPVEKQAQHRNPNFAPSSSSSSSSSCHKECPPYKDSCCDDSTSCVECCPDFETELVYLRNDVGFYHFDFPAGNSDAVAFRTFYTFHNYWTFLTVLDCFCSGDRFRVTIEYFDFEYPLTFFTTKAPFSTDCEHYETNPFNCLVDPQEKWARTKRILLPPGNWNISITPTNTPYLAGTGYAILQAAYEISENALPACYLPGHVYYPCEWGIFD